MSQIQVDTYDFGVWCVLFLLCNFGSNTIVSQKIVVMLSIRDMPGLVNRGFRETILFRPSSLRAAVFYYLTSITLLHPQRLIYL